MSLFNRSDKTGEAKPADAKPRDGMAQQQFPTAPSDAAKKIESSAPRPADKPAEPPRPAPSAAKPTPTPPQQKTGVNMASVISKALKITGELESTEDIQIDGKAANLASVPVGVSVALRLNVDRKTVGTIFKVRP